MTTVEWIFFVIGLWFSLSVALVFVWIAIEELLRRWS